MSPTQVAADAHSGRPRLLLIDDDRELCELLTRFLDGEGFEVEAVHAGAPGLLRAAAGGHDLVVLDVMLPDVGGMDVLRKLRAQGQTPVLMLTARGDDVDRIVGLELGADDYLPKPFNSRELVARIRAILRRSATPSAGARRRQVGDVEIDFGARSLRVGGVGVELTGVEFNVLELLAESAGTVVAREDLFRAALGRREVPFDRSLDMHVSNLRKKLGCRPDGSPRIKTVRGFGYVLVMDA